MVFLYPPADLGWTVHLPMLKMEHVPSTSGGGMQSHNVAGALMPVFKALLPKSPLGALSLEQSVVVLSDERTML